MIIYNSIIMVNINPMNYGYIVRWQSNLVYTIETVLPDCDKPYHMNNGFQQMWVRLKICGTMHAVFIISFNKKFRHNSLSVDYSSIPSRQIIIAGLHKLRFVMRWHLKLVYLVNFDLICFAKKCRINAPVAFTMNT